MADLGSYTVGAIIGRGEFATVKLGEHTASGRKVALKFLEKQRMDQNVQREITNQGGLCHKHVIKMVEVLEAGDLICMALEYAPGGDLFDHIVRHVRLKEDEAKRIFSQLADGVQHCHNQMVVHRDLKPENILLDADCNVKIADFGLSSQWRPGQVLTESCGSPNYAAPELLSKNCSYEGPEIDLWSCGVILYTLLCGELPFDEDNYSSLFRKIKNGRYTIPGYVPVAPKGLIVKMLTVDPSARIGLQEIRQHFWLKGEEEVAVATSAAAEAVGPVIPTVALSSEIMVVPTTVRCSRVSKSASQLISCVDRASCRRMRTGSGRLRRQYSGPPKSTSWPREGKTT